MIKNMSRWKFITFFGLLSMATVMFPSTGNAQVAVVSREIRIQAQVLPTHTVITDEQGIIREIISNSSHKDATIKVYSDHVSQDTALDATPEIIQQYRHAMKYAPKRIGVIYSNTQPTTQLFQVIRQPKSQRPLNPIALAVISR